MGQRVRWRLHAANHDLPASVPSTRPQRVARAAPTAMDGFERALIEYVVLRAPYGGPPAEEILPRFGIHHGDLANRVREIAAARLNDNPPDDERALLGRALAAGGDGRGGAALR